MMVRVSLVLCLAVVLMVPALSVAAEDSAFAVFVNPVKNRVPMSAAAEQARQVKDGLVEITSLTKVEVDKDGDLLGQTTFFFPMDAAALADYFTSTDGACSLASLCDGVTSVQKAADGKGWSAEMKVDLDKLNSEGGNLRALWSPAAIQLVQAQKERKYSTRFEVKREDASGLATIRYSLANGKLLQKAEIVLRIEGNGKEGALVTVSTRTHSTLLGDTAQRVQFAKQILRSVPKIVDQGLTKIGR